MTYARFYYAELFPKVHGKVIHLDTDTIVQGNGSMLYGVHIIHLYFYLNDKMKETGITRYMYNKTELFGHSFKMLLNVHVLN